MSARAWCCQRLRLHERCTCLNNNNNPLCNQHACTSPSSHASSLLSLSALTARTSRHTVVAHMPGNMHATCARPCCNAHSRHACIASRRRPTRHAAARMHRRSRHRRCGDDRFSPVSHACAMIWRRRASAAACAPQLRRPAAPACSKRGACARRRRLQRPDFKLAEHQLATLIGHRVGARWGGTLAGRSRSLPTGAARAIARQ